MELDVKKIIDKAVRASARDHTVQRMTEAGGGDINRSFLVDTDKTRLFVKINDGVPADFFEKEAMGLAELKKTGAVNVPDVIGYNGKSDPERFLVLSYIKDTRFPGAEERLGEQLAAMHRTEKPFYGLGHDNYIGTFQQENGEYDSWPAYYREKRLLPQIGLALEKGFLNERQAEKHVRLAETLPRWLPGKPCASVLHGDLWGGNWMTGEDGSPFLIDPAVLYGDFRMDLAMTALFGGFTERFYSAYEAASEEPLNRDIWPLYQLFYVYMHLNSFGESYLPHAERIVKRYMG